MTILVTIDCYEPMGRDRQVRQPWSDLSVTFIDPSTTQELRFEMTLISRECLERDLAIKQKELSKSPTASTSQLITVFEQIIDRFNQGSDFHVISQTPDDRTAEIYTSTPYIDQLEAERMLIHFLGTRGFTGLSFQWVWPEYVASVG